MILVDFDNTIIKNKWDVDLGNSLQTFLKTWRNLKTEVINEDLIFWLKERPKMWHIFTNRPYICLSKIEEHLSDLNLRPLNIYCLEGEKEKILKHFNEIGRPFLIDNNRRYNPHILMDESIRLPYINYKYNKWLEEDSL